MIKQHLVAPLEISEASFSSSTPTPNIHTPPSGDTSPHGSILSNISRLPSQKPSPHTSKTSQSVFPPPLRQSRLSPDSNLPKDHRTTVPVNSHPDLDLDDDGEEMGERPSMHRPIDGRSQVPLLKEERGRASYDSRSGGVRPPFHTRLSRFRSRSPELEGSSVTRKKYTYAAFFLVLCLVSFTVQTETAVYIQHELGWKKPYCML